MKDKKEISIEIRNMVEMFCDDNGYYYEINGWGQIEILDQDLNLVAKIDVMK